MTDTINCACPSLIQKNLIFNEVDMQPLDCFNPANFNMYLPALETLSTWHSVSNVELFPHKSLAQAVSENFNPHFATIGTQLTTQRPTTDGLAVSRKLYTNCNVLAASNTQNLNLTVPKILPSTTSQV